MGTIIEDYIGTTIGIHSPIPYEAPDRQGSLKVQGLGLGYILGRLLGFRFCRIYTMLGPTAISHFFAHPLQARAVFVSSRCASLQEQLHELMLFILLHRCVAVSVAKIFLSTGLREQCQNLSVVLNQMGFAWLSCSHQYSTERPSLSRKST